MKELENIGKLKDDLFEHSVFESKVRTVKERTEHLLIIMRDVHGVDKNGLEVLRKKISHIVSQARIEVLEETLNEA